MKEQQLKGEVLFIGCFGTCAQKETGLLIPFVVAILGTKFLTNLCLVRQNSAQLRTVIENCTEIELNVFFNVGTSAPLASHQKQ